MSYRFSKNIVNTPKSFIREILKLTLSSEIISFAGGLPNSALFPIQALKEASDKVLRNNGASALQYATTEGFLPLREYISKRYKAKGLDIPAEEILIVSGSQQALDLVGKVFLNPGDDLMIEKPGYLGAIQAFSLFGAMFHEVELEADGLHINDLKTGLRQHNPKVLYITPNFQNPTGLTYSREKREQVGTLIRHSHTVIVEDDPYGELRFIGETLPAVKTYAQQNGILLGSFSKTVAPGFRLGWVCSSKEIMDRLVAAKQGTDLHTNSFSQQVLYQYLADNDLDEHINKIRAAYHKQREAMVDSIQKYLPEDVSYTKPEGGMFVWVTLPEGYNTMDLFNIALKHKVAFVPGDPFYVDGRASNSMRLNYTASSEEIIVQGIKNLAAAIKEYLKK